MMKIEEDKNYIIALSYFSPSESQILMEIKAEYEREFNEAIDLSKYIGKGIGIYIYVCGGLVSDSDETDDYDLVLNFEESNYGFLLRDIIEDFSLIEGEFQPGIYQHPIYRNFYNFKHVSEVDHLCRIFHDMLHQAGSFKLVCLKDRINFRQIQEDGIITFYKINGHPQSYFDLYCPVCNQRIYTHRIIEDCACEIVENFCSHYIGTGPKKDGLRMRRFFDDLQIPFKVIENEFFVQTEDGWQKLIVYLPPEDGENSYWKFEAEDVETRYYFSDSKFIKRRLL